MLLCWALLYLASFLQALARSNGPPLEACDDLDPAGHTAIFASQELGFNIESADEVSAGKRLTISISGNREIKGVFIQVRDETDTTVGTFSQPSSANLKLVDCFGIAGSAFGHANNAPKGNSVEAVWNAPDSCNGRFTIRASVVVQFSVLQTGLTREIICSPATTTISQTTTTIPPTTITMPPTTASMPPTTTTMPAIVKTMTTTTTMPSTTTTMPQTTTTIPPTTITMPPTTASMPPTTATMPPTTTTMPPIVKTMTTTTTMPSTTTTMPSTTTTMPPTTTTMPQTTTTEEVSEMSTSSLGSNSNTDLATNVVQVTTGGGRCIFSNFTRVPNKYRTSFESDDLNGWINKQTMVQKFTRRNVTFYFLVNKFAKTSRKAMQMTSSHSNSTKKQIVPKTPYGWRRNMGATPTAGTGPSLAGEGNYYMHMEADDLRRGEWLTLYTRKELRGCFCLHLKHYHNVNDFSNTRSKHRLSIRTQNRVLMTRSSPSNEWEDVWVQVDTPRYTMIRILGIRGADNLGDVAIDDVSISAGMCPMSMS